MLMLRGTWDGNLTNEDLLEVHTDFEVAIVNSSTRRRPRTARVRRQEPGPRRDHAIKQLPGRAGARSRPPRVSGEEKLSTTRAG